MPDAHCPLCENKLTGYKPVFKARKREPGMSDPGTYYQDKHDAAVFWHDQVEQADALITFAVKLKRQCTGALENARYVGD